MVRAGGVLGSSSPAPVLGRPLQGEAFFSVHISPLCTAKDCLIPVVALEQIFPCPSWRGSRSLFCISAGSWAQEGFLLLPQEKFFFYHLPKALDLSLIVANFFLLSCMAATSFFWGKVKPCPLFSLKGFAIFWSLDHFVVLWPQLFDGLSKSNGFLDHPTFSCRVGPSLLAFCILRSSITI